jgi:hypothetical protein
MNQNVAEHWYSGHVVDGMPVDKHLRAGRGIARAELAEETEGELQKRMDLGEGRMNRFCTLRRERFS